jgi:hypothetical protein
LRKGWRPAIFTASLALLTALAVSAIPGTPQQRSAGAPPAYPGNNTPGTPNEAPGMPPLGPDDRRNPVMEQMERRQAILRNQDRQKQLVEDTKKLLDLATQLKTAVDKTNQDTLSIDVIKKADEIAKLAKSVRDKMKAE